MNKTVAALQRLFMELGGDLAKVKDCKTSVEVLNAISEKYDGEGGAKLTAKAIDNIANVAGNIGGGGEPVRYTIEFVAYRAPGVPELSFVQIFVGEEQYNVPTPAPGDTFEFEAHPGQEIEVHLEYADDIVTGPVCGYLPFYENEYGDNNDLLLGFLPEASQAAHLRCPIRVSS